MIDRALYARIRRLYFADHWKVGTIAAEIVNEGETPGTLRDPHE